MGYVLPGWLDEILDFIGINWPNVDEDDYREMADAMRELADAFDDHAGEAHGAVSRLLSSSEGWAVDALQEHWGKVKGSHLEQLPEVARLFADAMDVVADLIYAMKVKAEIELGVMAASVGISIGLAFVTGGLSALLGAAQITAMREVVRRIIKEAADQIVEEVMARVTEPVAAKLEDMVADAILDLAQDAIGPAGGGEGGKGTSAMNLNSANGPSGGGPAGGGAGRMRIDHVEYEKAAGDLGRISGTSLNRLNGSLDRAHGASGRTRGKDPFTLPIDGLVNGATKGMKKAVEKIVKHTGDTIPRNVRVTSENHKRNEKANEDALRKIIGDGDGKGGPNSPSAGPGGSGGKRGGGKPNKSERPADAELAQRARENSDKTKEGDPIDMATGEVLQTQTDLALPGILPLLIERTHLSSYRDGRFFGPSWTSTLDERLERVPGTDELWWHGADGSSKRYSHAPDLIGEKVLPREGHRIPLTCVQGTSGWDLAITDPRTGLTRRFLPTDGTTAESGDTTIWWLADIQDRNGNTISFHRDEDGAPSTITHSGGYHVVVDVSDDPRRVTRIAVSDRAANGSNTTVMAYGYDPQGNLSELVNSSGLPMRFGYDAEHRMTSWTDRNDSTFTYIYDDHGRVIRTVGPDGMLSCQLVYDSEQRLTRYTDSTGATTTYHLNHLGQTIAETSPLGHTTHTEWDRYDRVLARTDALGHTTRYGYDELGHLIEAEHADGTRTTVTHNTLNLPETTTLPDGGQIRQEYDTRGNLTRLTGPDGSTTAYTHDPSGAIASVTDALGHTATAHNDNAGLPLTITDPLGATTTYARDGFGRPTSVVDALGATTTVEWTVEGKPARRTSAGGSTETWQWDGEGNCLVHTDACGGQSRYSYTHFDQPVSRITPDGATYTFVYDTELRLTGVAAPNSLVWTYRYDASGCLTAETDFDGRCVTYAYDAAGQLTSRTTPLGETIAYELDPRGRITAKDAAGAVTRYTHDAVGRLATATSPTSTLTVRRDQAGRITSETVDGRSLTYTYDALGRHITRTTPTGVVTQSTYDDAGNRTHLTLGGHTTAFQHDLLGRELERRFGNDLLLNTTWDPAGRPTAQTLIAPGAGGAAARTLRARTYAYRPDSHLIALTDQLTGNTQHFDLDPVGRPLAVTAHDWQENYAYDLHGNQTQAQWPERAADPAARGERSYAGTQLLTAGRITYAYDAAGRTVTRRKTRLSRKPDSWHYTWDAEDRLTSCTTPDGTVWQYTYDPLGRRTGKHQLTAEGTAVAESVHFTWDGTRLAEQVTRTTGITLTWDHDGHRPLAQYERKPLTQDEVDTRFFAIVTDLVGTPTELVDETGRIAWHSRTTTWGATTWNTGATAYTPLRYPGQYADLETGLHHNYFRHYDPETARYISVDPLGLAPGPNPARYVDNPRRWSDPLGLAPYETFYRVMSQKEFDGLGPNGEISVKGTENFVTQEKDYVTGIAERTTRRGGRNAEKYTHLVEYQMEPGTRDALIAAGRGSGDNMNKIRDELGIDLEEIGDNKNFVHVKYERDGLNFGLRPGSTDVFNSRIVGVSHQLLR